MTELSQICYKKTFLNQVIVRMDFLEFIPTIKLENDEVTTVIKKYFPRKGKNKIMRYNLVNVTVNINQANVHDANQHAEEGMQFEYCSADGKNKFFLSNRSMIFEINKYSSFANHYEGIKDITNALYSCIVFTASRTGIRYINVYDSRQMKIQKKFFSKEIAATLKSNSEFDNKPIALSRSMHISEYQEELIVLNFRYGMYNPEYPNPIRNNSFVLDYDCFTEEPLTVLDSLLQFVSKGHELIQSLFETNITDALRQVMNNE